MERPMAEKKKSSNLPVVIAVLVVLPLAYIDWLVYDLVSSQSRVDLVAISPNRYMSAVMSEDLTDNPNTMITLKPTAEPFRPRQYVPVILVYGRRDLKPRWIDDYNLSVTIPAGTTVSKKFEEYDDYRIHYTEE